MRALEQPAPRPAPESRWTRRTIGGSTADRLIRGLVTGVIAVGAGVAVAVSPVNLAVIAAVIAAIWLIAIGRQSIAVFHGSLVVILVGYAFLDKGFAYFGAPPVYVGEITLALAAVATLYSLRHARFSLPLLFVVLFMAWGAVRTLPYVGTYGLLAIRDGVTWEYALFAIAVALTVRQDHLDRIVGLYRRGSLLLVWWMPVATILTLEFAASLPTFPGSPVSFVYYKAGDAGVQLAGVAAFVLLGLYSARDTTSFRQVALWAGWFVSAGLAALSRSAMLAMAATGACFLFVISVPRVFSLAFVSAVFVVMLLTVNPEVDLGLSRNVSVTQLIANLGEHHRRRRRAARRLEGLASFLVDEDLRLHDRRTVLVGRQGFRRESRDRRWVPGRRRAVAARAPQRASGDPRACGPAGARPVGASPTRLRRCDAQGRGHRATHQGAGVDPLARVGLRVLAGRTRQRLVRRLLRRAAGRHLVLVDDRLRSGADADGQRTSGRGPR